VLTTRLAANATGLEEAIRAQGGTSMIVELDLVSHESISRAFATIREKAGDPDVLVYNAGYLEGRDLPPDRGAAGARPRRHLREDSQHERHPEAVTPSVVPINLT
jgi:NAD(P)-dependent dehydrogenase (short-subunit alcohol dehydrogenase family)